MTRTELSNRAVKVYSSVMTPDKVIGDYEILSQSAGIIRRRRLDRALNTIESMVTPTIKLMDTARKAQVQ